MKNKSLITKLLTAALATAMSTTILAAPADSLVKMNTGICKFVLLDSRGVAPLGGWTLALESTEDGKAISSAVTGADGTAQFDVAQGRYIISVNEMDLAILETSIDQTIAECRIVVPDQPLLAGGADAPPAKGAGAAPAAGTGAKGAGFLGLRLTPFVVGGAVILVAGGGYAIYENNNNVNSGNNTPPPPPTTTRRSASPRPVSQ